MAKAPQTADVLAAICSGADAACLIVCPDFTRRDRAIARIRETRLTQRAVTTLLGSEVDRRKCRELIDQSRNLSLFEPCRGFVIRNYEDIPAECIKELLPSLDDRSQTALFVFAGSEARAQHPLVKSLRGRGLSLELAALEGVELRRWIEREAKRLGVTIDNAAVEQLLALSGGDLDTVATALEQTALYATEPRISARDLGELFAIPSRTREYELLDSAMAGNRGKLLALCEQLLREGKNAFLLLNLLHRSVLQYLTIQSMRADGLSEEAMRAKSGLPPWLFQKVSSQAKNYAVPQLKKCVDVLVTADSKLKGRSLGEPLIIAEVMQALRA